MNISEFDKIVEDARSKHPFWFEGERELPVTGEKLAEFEKTAGYNLPSHYKYFASRYGCGYFGFTSIYSVFRGEWYVLDKIKLIPELNGKFLPISDNGSGDFYGFIIDGSKCSDLVYFADHEQGYSLFQTQYEDLFSFIVETGLRP